MVKSKDQVKAARKNRRAKLKGDNKNLQSSSKWYTSSRNTQRLSRKCKAPRAAKLRQGIVPGSVLILLSGRFRGRRVIFLKQLESGLLLVTGPYKINGVPLKRVNQAYVIATKTQVKLGNLNLDKVNDAFFQKTKVARTELGAVVLPKDDAEKKKRISENRLSTQNTVDTEVNKAIKATPLLKEYLRNRFALKNGQQAHNLVY